MQASCVPADGFMPPGPPPPPPPPLFTLAAFEILELVLMIVFGPFVMVAVADDYSTSSLIFLICSTSTPSLSSIRSSVSSFVTWNLCRSSLPFSSSILSCLSLSSFFFLPASSDSTSHSN
uniref:Uncharacterized protein n=1 Tax=Anopheles melas TaxID=34690 RepID=A0A182UK76_9DIPT